MFRQLRDIEHVTSTPRYPQSNGQAELAIGTVKNLVKKASEDGSWHCRALGTLYVRDTARHQHRYCSVVDAERHFRCHTLRHVQLLSGYGPDSNSQMEPGAR